MTDGIAGRPRTHGSAASALEPVACICGHGIAALLGADPKRKMDEDLARMKTLIECGIPPHDAAQPMREPPPSLM
jgi:hypothetical protein